MKKISFILLARHGRAESIICVNDPYNTLYTAKDDERDLRVQGTPHAPNTYMKLSDPFRSIRRVWRTLDCHLCRRQWTLRRIFRLTRTCTFLVFER